MTAPTPAAGVDRATLESGLDARLGADRGGWQFEVGEQDGEDRIAVVLVSPAGTRSERTFVLAPGDPQSQARELAADLVLATETWTEPDPPRNEKVEDEPLPEPPEPAEPAGRPPARHVFVGFAGGASLNVQAPLSVAGGAGLQAGVGAWGRRLQVRGFADWARAGADSLDVDRVRVGGAVAIGSPLYGADHWWLGAYAAGSAAWFRADGQQIVSRWGSSEELAFLARWTRRGFYIEGRVGAEMTLPPIRATGEGAVVRFTALRPSVQLGAGFDFGI